MADDAHDKPWVAGVDGRLHCPCHFAAERRFAELETQRKRREDSIHQSFVEILALALIEDPSPDTPFGAMCSKIAGAIDAFENIRYPHLTGAAGMNKLAAALKKEDDKL